MFVFRRDPITGEETWQDLSTLRSAPAKAADLLSPGRALSEDVPLAERLDPAAHSYPIRSFSLRPGKVDELDEPWKPISV